LTKRLLILFILLFATPALSANYHFSTSGNDTTGDGSSGAPYKTTNKLNDLAESPGFSDGDEIRFKCGDTFNNANGSTEDIGYDTAKIDWGGVDNITITRYGTCTGTETANGELPYTVGNDPFFDADEIQPIWLSLNQTSRSTGWTVEHLNIGGSGHSGNNGRALFEVHDAEDFTMQYNTIDGHSGSTAYEMRSRFVGLVDIIGDTIIQKNVIKNNYDLDDIADGKLLDWQYDSHLMFLDFADSEAPQLTSGSLLIDQNYFEGAHADAIQWWMFASSERATISDNRFKKWGENAIDQKSCSYVTYENNIFERTWTVYKDVSVALGNPEDGPDSNLATVLIQRRPDAGNPVSNEIIFRYNKVEGMGDNRGFEVQDVSTNVDAYGNWFQSNGTSAMLYHGTNIDFYNNIIVTDTDYANYYGKGGGSREILVDGFAANDNIRIFNNSFYMNDTNQVDIIEWDCHSSQTGNVVANNVFHMIDTSGPWALTYENDSGCTSASDFPTTVYNAIYNSSHDNRVKMNGTEYDKDEQATYRSAWSATGSLLYNTGTPGMESPTDLEFWPGSGADILDKASATYAPALGLDLTSTWDPVSITTNTRADSAPDDIGAYENPFMFEGVTVD
jgi:hypothetical protein